MPILKGTFEVPLTQTKDLKPPSIDCSWEIEFGGDAVLETTLAAYYKGAYEKGLKDVMTQHAKTVLEPLISKCQDKIQDALIAQLAVQNATSIRAAYAAVLAFKNMPGSELNVLIDNVNRELNEACTKTGKQKMDTYAEQFSQSALAYAKKQIKGEIKNKKIRHMSGIALRSALAVGAAAASMAVFVASLGTAAPVFAGVAVATGGLGLGSAVVKMGRSIADASDLEQRTLELLVKDVTEIREQLAGISVKNKGVGKHIVDLSMYYSKRREKTAKLLEAVDMWTAQLSKAEAAGARLGKLSPKAVARQQADMKSAKAALAKATALAKSSEERQQAIEKVLSDANTYVTSLADISARGAKGALDGITRINMKSADTWLSVVDNVTAVARVTASTTGNFITTTV